MQKNKATEVYLLIFYVLKFSTPKLFHLFFTAFKAGLKKSFAVTWPTLLETCQPKKIYCHFSKESFFGPKKLERK